MGHLEGETEIGCGEFYCIIEKEDNFNKELNVKGIEEISFKN